MYHMPPPSTTDTHLGDQQQQQIKHDHHDHHDHSDHGHNNSHSNHSHSDGHDDHHHEESLVNTVSKSYINGNYGNSPDTLYRQAILGAYSELTKIELPINFSNFKNLKGFEAVIQSQEKSTDEKIKSAMDIMLADFVRSGPPDAINIEDVWDGSSKKTVDKYVDGMMTQIEWGKYFHETSLKKLEDGFSKAMEANQSESDANKETIRQALEVYKKKLTDNIKNPERNLQDDLLDIYQNTSDAMTRTWTAFETPWFFLVNLITNPINLLFYIIDCFYIKSILKKLKDPNLDENKRSVLTDALLQSAYVHDEITSSSKGLSSWRRKIHQLFNRKNTSNLAGIGNYMCGALNNISLQTARTKDIKENLDSDHRRHHNIHAFIQASKDHEWADPIRAIGGKKYMIKYNPIPLEIDGKIKFDKKFTLIELDDNYNPQLSEENKKFLQDNNLELNSNGTRLDKSRPGEMILSSDDVADIARSLNSINEKKTQESKGKNVLKKIEVLFDQITKQWRDGGGSKALSGDMQTEQAKKRIDAYCADIDDRINYLITEINTADTNNHNIVTHSISQINSAIAFLGKQQRVIDESYKNGVLGFKDEYRKILDNIYVNCQELFEKEYEVKDKYIKEKNATTEDKKYPYKYVIKKEIEDNADTSFKGKITALKTKLIDIMPQQDLEEFMKKYDEAKSKSQDIVEHCVGKSRKGIFDACQLQVDGIQEKLANGIQILENYKKDRAALREEVAERSVRQYNTGRHVNSEIERHIGPAIRRELEHPPRSI